MHGAVRDPGDLPEDWFGNQAKEQPGSGEMEKQEEGIGYMSQEVLPTIFSVIPRRVEEQMQPSRGGFPRDLVEAVTAPFFPVHLGFHHSDTRCQQKRYVQVSFSNGDRFGQGKQMTWELGSDPWTQRMGKPLSKPLSQQAGQDGLVCPPVPYPQFTGEDASETQNCKVPACGQSSGGTPGSLQVAQGLTGVRKTLESAAKHHLKFRLYETTHSLPKAFATLTYH
ncbi:hypothetical protein BTVI_140228 [Pitangus sulphuratus]|nr:hypothetical protein BTVI_140228 [Pitangus sulphuratus]